MGTTGSFSSDTERFLEWFKDQPGATFLDDIEILDLRHRNAGRGIGGIYCRNLSHWVD